MTRHPEPPLNQINQQGCQLYKLELRNPKMYLLFHESGPVRFWSNLLNSPTPPDPLRIDSFIYQSIALMSGFRICNLYFYRHVAPKKYDNYILLARPIIFSSDFLIPVVEVYGTLYQSCSFFLINVRSGFSSVSFSFS